MIISQNFSLLRILRTTWKVDIFLIITCLATYYLHTYIVTTAIQIPATLATLLGTAIAFFVGFNNNQAYDRWWEARKIWGSMVNDSRTWARQVLNYTNNTAYDSTSLAALHKILIYRHIAFVYAVKANLRRENIPSYEKYLTQEDMRGVQQETNKANAILSLQAKLLETMNKDGRIDEFRFIQMDSMLTACTDHMGKSERIANTVYPTSYIYFTQLFIWILVIFTTLILAENTGLWSVLIGWIVGFVFHVTQQNGMKLMKPFEEIQAGIPLDQISRTIEINLLEMLGETDIPKPVEPIDGEYIC